MVMYLVLGCLMDAMAMIIRRCDHLSVITHLASIRSGFGVIIVMW